MAKTRTIQVLIPVSLVCAAIGCGDDRFKIVPVSGVILIDGEPIENAYVTFDPRSTSEDGIAGPGSFGRTDAQGRYALTTYKRQQGAVIATHRVAIRTMVAEEGPDGTPRTIRRELLPPKYHQRSTLTFVVEGEGTDQANFDLTTRN